MPFVSVSSASDLRGDRTRSVESSTLLGMERSSDNHIRTMLDDVEPSSLYRLFDETLRRWRPGRVAVVDQPGRPHVDRLGRDAIFLLEQTVVPELLTRKHANGQIDYFHTVVAASVVKPGKNWVLPLRPEFIEPQQGYDKQDCESRAARRWLALNASRYSKLNPVYLGDDIYSKQPVCEEVLAVGAHFLFVCKPDSHKTMNEYLTGVEVPALSRQIKRGKKFFTYTWRGCWACRSATARMRSGQLAGNHHPRFQRQDHLSQQLRHRSAGRRRQRRGPRRRRKGEVENRERDLQHPENQGVQSRTQFRPRKKQPVGGPRHSQSDRLRIHLQPNSPTRPGKPRSTSQAPESVSSTTCAP